MKAAAKKRPVLKKKFAPKKKLRKGSAKNGALYAVAIIAVVATFGGVMAGGALPSIQSLKTPPNPGPSYTCCDSGDGAACHPLTGPGQTITYNGAVYGLLKSNTAPGEVQHMVPTNDYTPDGHRIFINTSDTTADHSLDHTDNSECAPGMDLIGIPDSSSKYGSSCYGIKNDELIYVCKDTQQACAQQINSNTTPFDVYYRIADGPVPSPIAYDCPKPSGNLSSNGQQQINVAKPNGTSNLQLETFQVMQQQKPIKWLGAWCKPAVNLYPTQVSQIHVAVAPEGRLNYTDPIYPTNGWDVQAYPDGTIIDNNHTYPYLYWEAALPDNLITQPKQGYVIAYNDLGSFFTTTLPQMGLNSRETNQFSQYWLKALPKANYYFIGLMPQDEVNTLAPLTITPKPDSLLRVSLYFKALDQKIAVTPPQLSSFERKGFTVTEWGGFFKKDKNHPNFTCLM